MGRKIPTRRHHGVRDPIQQNAKRLDLIKDKINNPPEKKDYQKISHKLADFIKLKNDAKRGVIRKRRMAGDDVDEDKPENYSNKKPHRQNKDLPEIHPFPNENDDDYMRRVNRITRESIQEAEFEEKYGVEVIRNKQTGEIKIKKRPKDVLLEQTKKNSEKKAAYQDETKLGRDERNKLAKEMLRDKKREQHDHETTEYRRDIVQFGEVVHAPPHLVTPRMAKKAETVPRPGKKNLLLNQMFENKSKKEPNNQSLVINDKTVKTTKINLKGKRKDLPIADRQMIEEQQKNVMEIYRSMKKSQRADAKK